MKRCILMLIVGSLVGIMVYGCSGGGQSPSGQPASGQGPTGAVALYATDDPLQDYHSVMVTIDAVDLQNTGTGASCNVLTEPVTIDITQLANVLESLNMTNCPSVPYTSTHVEFNQALSLTDQNDTTATCNLTFYTDEQNHSNKLACNSGTCSLDIPVPVNVLANTTSELALDFILKDFDVTDFGKQDCSVTMKVSPLGPSDIGNKVGHGCSRGITGSISNLNTTAKTFVISKGKRALTVDYSKASYEAKAQPNIDQLLEFAVDKNLDVTVVLASIDFTSKTGTASTIYVQVEGTISGLDESSHTFTLTEGTTITIPVDYSDASANNRVQGTIANNVQVRVLLFGNDGTNYLAEWVAEERATQGGVFQRTITGIISKLDTAAKTFVISRGFIFPSVTVDYSKASYEAQPQPDIDQLLQFANDKHLPVEIVASSIDFVKRTIVASTVYVDVEGTVSALSESTHIFTLTHGATIAIPVDYSDAAANGQVEGTVANGVQAVAALFGYNGTNYLAHRLGIERERGW